MDMPVQTPIGELQPTLARLRAAHRSKVPDYAQRRDDLARLRGVFKARLDDMVIAIAADFGHRSRHETLVSDGMTVLAEIDEIGRASCRARVCQYVEISVVAVSLKKKQT